MADEGRPLSAGDCWRPTASGINRLQETADYVDNLKRSGGSIVNPRLRRELGTVVLVKNESATEETWPIWSPVGVCPPPGSPIDHPVRFANRPYFRGCRLDDYSFDDGMYRKLGITQEPIPYGKTGRVTIAGVTPALIHDSNAAGYYSRSDARWAMVRKHNDRWTLRLGPGGDGPDRQLNGRGIFVVAKKFPIDDTRQARHLFIGWQQSVKQLEPSTNNRPRP